MAKNERIEEFSDLLKDALHQSKTSMKKLRELFGWISIFTGVRRRKSTVDEEDDGGAKQTVQESSVPSVVPETTEEKTPVEKSVRKPIAFSQNGDDESVAKKKRGRKSKTETNDDLPTATVRFLSFDKKTNVCFRLQQYRKNEFEEKPHRQQKSKHLPNVKNNDLK